MENVFVLFGPMGAGSLASLVCVSTAHGTRPDTERRSGRPFAAFETLDDTVTRMKTVKKDKEPKKPCEQFKRRLIEKGDMCLVTEPDGKQTKRTTPNTALGVWGQLTGSPIPGPAHPRWLLGPEENPAAETSLRGRAADEPGLRK